MLPSSSRVNGGCSSSSTGSASNCGRGFFGCFGFSGTAGLRFAGVADRPSHEEPSGEVKERQAALLSSLAQEAKNLGHALGRLAPVTALLVHVSGTLAALTVWRRDDVERPAGEQGFELGAWAVCCRRMARLINNAHVFMPSDNARICKCRWKIASTHPFGYFRARNVDHDISTVTGAGAPLGQVQ